MLAIANVLAFAGKRIVKIWNEELKIRNWLWVCLEIHEAGIQNSLLTFKTESTKGKSKTNSQLHCCLHPMSQRMI